VGTVRDWCADALTADGSIVRLRPIAGTDGDSLTGLYRKGSADSLRLRFFGSPGEHVIETEVARLVRPPANDHEAVVAEENGFIVGVASYERRPADSSSAEFAVFVDDEQHGRGIGTLLLEHLTAVARRAGVTELAGDVLPTNVDMLKVARGLDQRGSATFESGIIDVRFQTVPDASALALADARDRAAPRRRCGRCCARGRSPWSASGVRRAASATPPCRRSSSTTSPGRSTRSTRTPPRSTGCRRTGPCRRSASPSTSSWSASRRRRSRTSSPTPAPPERALP